VVAPTGALAVGNVLSSEFGGTLRWIAPAAATRCLDNEPVAAAEFGHDLRRNLLDRAVMSYDPASSHGTGGTPERSGGRIIMAVPSVCDRYAFAQQLEFFNDAEPTAKLAIAARILAQRHSIYAHRRRHFNCFSRIIHAIGRIGLKHINTIAELARPTATSNSFADDISLTFVRPTTERKH
jgi:hypothetical protein